MNPKTKAAGRLLASPEAGFIFRFVAVLSCRITTSSTPPHLGAGHERGRWNSCHHYNSCVCGAWYRSKDYGMGVAMTTTPHMTGGEHTNGPWEAVPHSDGSGGFNIVTAPHDKAGLHHKSSDFIASVGVCPNPWQHGAAESAANAALIAAAPDTAARLREAQPVMAMLMLCGEQECIDVANPADKLRSLIDGVINLRERATAAEQKRDALLAALKEEYQALMFYEWYSGNPEKRRETEAAIALCGSERG